MLDLERIKVRLAAAMPGPWGQDEDNWWAIRDTSGDVIAEAILVHKMREGNADLIAHAPTDIAALVSEVERLREQNDLLRRRLYKEREARERALGYDDLTDDQKRDILANNIAQLDWPT